MSDVRLQELDEIVEVSRQSSTLDITYPVSHILRYYHEDSDKYDVDQMLEIFNKWLDNYLRTHINSEMHILSIDAILVKFFEDHKVEFPSYLISNKDLD
ncbi:hypothetical protein EVB32_175 [Rhizobium phage RHph_TM39]|uniref:Uncharacterized protein n=1 Tax=Rhizobium phage RHph_TM30 TaxID=2509764 RepID=A0A7S5R9K6_9CAUD|nr:hypothetical protein PQC16_gp174 [Rhizobium phage RHph_TM30]QIG71281.1 hypothetical protein EVB93_174 [Rhizobium phage RHph_TM30]QIG72007.1 hypothetical protein EVB95_173 [Rhizobium phage RHph_TM2_3B]QIG72370.1 hypothetical protein EVB96_174 [Rhizobium phage RHph_TM3_3_6]QIG77163.1 hypothetical protein EVB32_175 [Rhizobium phage RHph_TM39]